MDERKRKQIDPSWGGDSNLTCFDSSYMRYDNHWKGPTFKLIVGEDNEKLIVHESALPRDSPLLQLLAASGDRTVNLRDENAEFVKIYHYWLYRQEPPYHQDWELPKQELLARLYVFGDKMNDTAFQHFTLLDMKHKFQDGIDSDENEPLYYPHKDTVKTIFDSISDLDEARSHLVKMFVVYGKAEWLSVGDGTYPIEFMAEVAAEIVRARSKGFEAYLEITALESDEPSRVQEVPNRDDPSKDIERME